LCPVRALQRRQVPLNALFDLKLALVNLSRREVAIARVDCLELAAVDRDQSLGEQLEIAAQYNEAATHIANAGAVVT
jgi:hypothetical protein